MRSRESEAALAQAQQRCASLERQLGTLQVWVLTVTQTSRLPCLSMIRVQSGSCRCWSCPFHSNTSTCAQTGKRLCVQEQQSAAASLHSKREDELAQLMEKLHAAEATAEQLDIDARRERAGSQACLLQSCQER